MITGGADGIGSGIVEEFAKQGSRVAFIDIQIEKAAETIARCEALRVDHAPVFVEADLLDIPKVQAAIAGVISDFGSIEVFVNYAANDGADLWPAWRSNEHRSTRLGSH